jgi:phytoene dehydrogenase-like protein
MKYDAVVIGSGPNGLSAAIELARNNRKVLIVEGADSIGGGTRTAELTLPGFYHDYCSAVHPMGVLSPYLKTLPLADFGLQWKYPEASVAHPLDDEPTLLLTKSLKETSSYLGRDAEKWENLFSYFTKNGAELLEDSLKPLGFPKHPLLLTRFGVKAMWPAKGFANFTFKDKYAKALFAGCAAHSVLPLEKVFTAALGLVFGVTGHMEDWPVAEGGSKSITDSMAAYFQSLGGEITTSRWIKSIDDLPPSNAYLFDTDPLQLAQIAGSHLPSGFRKKLKKYNYGPGVFKLDWALDGPIPWKDKNALKASTVHVGGTLEEISISEKMAWKGQHCDKPFLILCQQSMFDESRAPRGKHTGYAYCHVPQGSIKDMTEAVENQVERFAPGFKQIILKRHTTNTTDFHSYNPNYLGGAITGGSADISQLFTRPVARFNPYTTPNPKIFICSAATPPGGGVHGMCGYWAARAVLKRFRIV